MKKLLVIAYLFPPAGDVGVYRTLKFAKYLRSFGWKPVVLTTRNGKFVNYDESLLSQIPADVEVHRVRSFEVFNEGRNSRGSDRAEKRTFWSRVFKRLCIWWSYLTIPDNRVTWAWAAVGKAKRLVKEEGIRHVYISGKPFSSFLIGCALKRRTGVNVVIDYRDPWTQNLNYYRRSALHTWIERKLEAYVVRCSDVVIANTEFNERRMVEEFGRAQSREKFITIHNGFDREDFADVETREDRRFAITYAGVFYYSVGSDYARSAGNDIMKTYSPLYFFEALERFFQRQPEAKANFVVNFMGLLGSGYDPIIRERRLDGVVNRLGYIDYAEHIAVLKSSDALLLVLSKGEKSRGWIPSKFFQYLGSGNPILALVPEGEVRDIIGRTRAGVCVQPDDVDGISREIENMYRSRFEGQSELERNEDEVNKFERRYQTGLLARALERC